jgi:hypothetical protein
MPSRVWGSLTFVEFEFVFERFTSNAKLELAATHFVQCGTQLLDQEGLVATKGGVLGQGIGAQLLDNCNWAFSVIAAGRAL